ncbi:MAG TPA: hypothetical protein VGH79_08205 [Gaiellaceae bacterium]|jgi:hypothetical protein
MARRTLRWMFRQPWAAALSGLLVVGVGVNNLVRTQEKLTAVPLTALGVFAVVGAVVARIKTGTWHAVPQEDDTAAS